MSEFLAVQFDWENLKNIVPPERLDYYAINQKDMNRVVGFGLLEKDAPVTMAIFFPYKNRKDEYSLVYIVVDPEHVREGIGSRLLAEAFHYLPTKDVKKIFCSCYEDEREIMEPFLKKSGFELVENIDLPVYGLDYPIIEKLGKGVKQALPPGDKIRSVRTLTRSELGKFYRMIQKVKSLYNVNNISKDYSMVYTAEDEIVAYLEAKVVDGDYIKISDLFVKDTKYSNYAIPGMVSQLMAHAKKSFDKQASVVLDMPKESLAKAIVKMYGAPYETEKILVVKKDLG